MRERINRLAKGIIDTEKPELVIQPERFSEELRGGELVRKELLAVSQNGLHCKGLVYSSDPRVRVTAPSFGGLRSHIYIEINTRHLEYGDTIEGSLFFVTNGGEYRIPYRFSICSQEPGHVMEELKTIADFGRLAKRDYDLAARVFEYRDFTELPFMQDIHVRTIYDGLLGQGNRLCQLEQFLVATGVKEAARLEVSREKREYFGLSENREEELILEKKGWGYLPIEVEIEGPFIQTMKKTVAETDFTEGICHFTYQISPAMLHGGRNFGRIRFVTPMEELEVEVEALGGQWDGTEPSCEGRYARYYLLRLEYESGVGEPLVLRSQMMDEVEQLMLVHGPSAELSLMAAELSLLSGKREAASEALEACRQQVTDARMEHPERYCFYQYLMLQMDPDREKEASLARLLQKYLDEGSAEYLILWLYIHLREQECFENPTDVLNRMMVLYSKGCHSPFLYQQALRIYNDEPQLLYGMGRFETQVLHYGARKGMVREELAVKAAKLISVNRNYQPLGCRTLKMLYETYPRNEILEAVCGMMIKGQFSRPCDFVWYERALAKRLSLTRLYEYFLYSLPEDYGKLLPKEVLLYFSYDHELDWHSRGVLYANIISYMKPEGTLYREYQKQMGMFAAEQILQGRINRDLAVIYEAAVFEDMVDLPMAKAFPALLRSCRISTENKKMRSVVIRYEELREEGMYPLRDGVAYVPIFSKGCVILFQDAYGNRYADVRHVRRAALSMPNMEQRCFDMDPEHPMLLLGAVGDAARKEIPEGSEILVIQRALSQLNLHPLFRRVLAGKVLAYYEARTRQAAQEDDVLDAELIPEFDETLLNRNQISSLCEILIYRNEMDRAYRLIQEYHCPVKKNLLKKLCGRMILNQLFDEDPLLLSLACQVFEEGQADTIILDYLCEHFNGLTEQMYALLKAGISGRVETYDLSERLLAQMMFADVTDHMDRVFAIYVERQKSSEILVKAYFTMKCVEYFLKGKPVGDSVFEYLESLVAKTIEKDRLSTIYLLVLTKYYAGLPRLSQEQRELCQTVTDILIAEGVVVPHLKELKGQIRIPADILDKAMIQYIGRRDSRVELQIRILPQQERFHSDDMKRVYQGVFVKQKVLFEGETMEYRIYEEKGGERLLMEQGQVTAEGRGPEDADSRFRLLNQMSACLSLREEEGLKETMREYMRKTAAVEAMFSIL